MKNTKQTEIELWYNFSFDILRIVYKDREKNQLVYQCRFDGWFESMYKSNDISFPTFSDYEKIGEL